MAISYYGYTLSPNQIETGEGFLICKNVPIARIGDQDYLGSEVGMPERELVTVHRPEEEVFSAEAIASFEGKPFTNDHPPVLLDPENATQYERGHVQNVRRGSGEFAEFLVGDIHVHDAQAIEDIQRGKREISCGYECEYHANADGTLTQRKIRGNHVALVDQGRAGSKAAIMDSHIKQADTPPERTKQMKKNTTLLKLLGIASAGKSAEEISQLAMDTAEALESAEKSADEVAPAANPAPAAEPQADACGKDACGKDEDPMAELNAKLDKLIALLTPEEPKDEDPIEAALKEMGEEVEEKAEETPVDEAPADDPASEEAHVVPAEEMDEEKAEEEIEVKAESMDKAILKALREPIAGISDPAQRKAVTDALLGAVKRPAKGGDSARIAQAVLKNAQTAKGKTMDLDAVQSAYDALNPHKKGAK